MKNFPLTNNGGINGNFLPLTKALSIDQHVFGEADGSDNFVDKQDEIFP